MSRDSHTSRRRRVALRPAVEGMESRLVLSAAGVVHTAVIHHGHHAISAASNRLTGRISGSYQANAGSSETWASTVLIQGNGPTSAARRSVVAGIIDVPNAGVGVPTLGILSIAPTGNTTDQLRLRIWSSLDATGTPTTSNLNWSVDPTSTGVYRNATGQGTVRIVYPRSRGLHAESAGGRFTMNLKGTLTTS